MILLCDEDVGTGVPDALKAVGYDAHSLVSLSLKGCPDEFWLEKAGQRGWLVLSRNKKMLKVKAEKDTIVRHRVGIVFLTSGDEHPRTMLLQVLKRWDDLELLLETTPRPFARFLSGRNQLLDKFGSFYLPS